MLCPQAIPTDKYPVGLSYVPHTGQVWVLNWRSDQDRGTKTIQVIRDAVEKRKHATVHLEPVRGQFDLIQDLFLPPVGRVSWAQPCKLHCHINPFPHVFEGKKEET